MPRPRASRAFENVARRLGYVHIAGVDEVGRGCLAGPVVAGAVVLHPDRYVPHVADSKVLSAEQREHLFAPIVAAAVCWHVAVVPPDEIDRLNIHRASLEAMRRAILALNPLPGYILVDGFRIPNLTIAQRSVIGGDRRCTAVAAASILAKVTRDRMMCDLDREWPEYDFKTHKGYITDVHTAALLEHGPSPVHRMRFVNVRRAAGVEGWVPVQNEPVEEQR